MRRAAPLLLIAALALGACSYFRGDHPAPPRGPVYSPNGEPLSGGPLGHPSCQEALGRWFDRVDTTHRGTIDFEQFIADARRQFAVMDLAKDGVITPAELAQYREPYDAEASTAGGGGRMPGAAGAPQRPHAGSGGGGGESKDDDDAIAEDRPDPVMLADVTLRNRVTLADFLAYARRNFVELDTGHDGRLVKADLLKSCGKNGSS